MFGSTPRLGWKPNPPDPADYSVDRLGLGTPDPDVERVDLTTDLNEVLNQGSTSSCVANAFAAAIDIRESRAGLSYLPASRLFMYYNARRYHSGHLFDGGTFIRAAAKGLTKLGVCNRSVWPFSTSRLTICRRPSWAAYMKAYGRKGGAYYAIQDHGEDRVKAVRAALVAGFPIVFGTNVTRDFMNPRGPIIVDRPSPSADYAGGHAMAIVGFDGPRYMVLNSWGTGWRSGGVAWFTEDYLHALRDLTIVEGWARLRNE